MKFSSLGRQVIVFALTAIIAASLSSCTIGTASVTPTPTPTPQPSVYLVNFDSPPDPVTLLPNQPDNLSASLGTTIFTTTDPKYGCYNSLTVNIYTSPNEPGLYVIIGSCPRTLKSIYGTFTPTPSPIGATILWNGNTDPLTNIPYDSLSTYSDAKYYGIGLNFQTTDPRYACLNHLSLKVFSAIQEYPGYLIANSVPDECVNAPSVMGTWKFQPGPAPFTAYWFGHLVNLSIADPIPQLPDSINTPYSIQNIQIPDPTSKYFCFNDTSLPVFVADKEFHGDFVAYGGCNNTVAWLFPKSGNNP